MSSPSPDTQKSADHACPPATETGDHAILPPHAHSCLCNEKPNLENPKSETTHSHCLSQGHHLNVINLSHAPPATTNHVHPVNQPVHIHSHSSPKIGNIPKALQPKCNCHLQEGCEGNPEVLDENVAQSRKLEPDDRIEVSPLPPALPPRPPPRPRFDGQGTLSNRSITRGSMQFVMKFVFDKICLDAFVNVNVQIGNT